MGGSGSSAVASPTAPASSSSPPNSVERLEEQLREAARQRDKLVERQREGVERMRALRQELGEAVDADVDADKDDSVAAKGDANGDISGNELKDGLKQLQMEIDTQLQTEQASMKNGGSSELVDPTDMSLAEETLNGKRKRNDSTENGEPQATRESSRVTCHSPLQPPGFKFGKGALDLDADNPEARSLAAAFRVATRYSMLTGESVPWSSLEEAFQAYTGRLLGEDTRSALSKSLAQFGIVATDRSRDPSRECVSSKHQIGPWLPGTQYLDAPSFVISQGTESQGDTTTSSAEGAALCAYIENEKQLLADVDASVVAHADAQTDGEKLRTMVTEANFVSITARKKGTIDTHLFLAQQLGTHSQQITMTCRRFRELTGVFHLAEIAFLPRWVEQERQNNFITQHSSTPRLIGGQATPDVSSQGFDKPFSLAEDSITRQLGRRQESGSSQQNTSKRRRRIDPMKMLCPYELNGICNDESCAYLHSRDFAEQDEERDGGESENSPRSQVCSLPPDDLAFLSNITATRRKYLSKWPLITPTTLTNVAVEDVHAIEQTVNRPVPAAAGSKNGASTKEVTAASVDDDSWTDYLALAAPDGITSDRNETSANLRYYNEHDQRNEVIHEIEKLRWRVEEHPGDSDAWLRLAIRQLDLDISPWMRNGNDSGERASGQSRLQLELLTLSTLLHDKARASNRSTSIDERSVRKCLHVLSRALEVEANLYCEAVWLLYLHMCRQISDRQLEEEIAEKAAQFVVTSHRLWLRYLSVIHFTKVSNTVAIHGRLLQMLCQIPSNIEDNAEDGNRGAGDTGVPRTIALLAVTLALCSTLLQLGATHSLHQFLDVMVYSDNSSAATREVFSWCATVRAHLSCYDLIVLHLVYAHVLVYNRLPMCAEDWLASAGCEEIKITRFAYTIESFRDDFKAIHGSSFPSTTRAKLLNVYAHVYQHISTKHGKDPRFDHAVVDVVLNNWMILIAELYLPEDDTLELLSFFDERLPVIEAYPAATFTASKLLLSHLDDAKRAEAVVLSMISKSELDDFGAALHFYLFASHFLPDLMFSLEMNLIDVMGHIANTVGADVESIKATIREMKEDDSPISKMREFERILSPMLDLWMGRLSGTSQKDPSSCSDVYMGLDICHLMAQLVQPSVAIAGLDRILLSPKFRSLDVDSRQLAWSFRFLLQINELELEAQRDLPFADGQTVQHVLTQLFKRYMNEMGERSEFTRQIEMRINSETDINKAVIECLYPRQHQSLTSDVSLELFHLCSITVASQFKAQFFSAFADELSTEPRFSLAFAEAAGRDWEWRSARTALKRALITNSTTSWHADVLRAIVAGDIKNRHMKAASSLLAAELATHPSSLVTWQLVIGLEILFGDASSARAEAISRELMLRGLPLSFNSFGDAAVLGRGGELAPAPLDKRTHMSWCSLSLPVFPRSVLLHTELVSLNLSGNQLVELPSDLGRLECLEVLNVSENALMDLPDSLSRLRSLISLNVAHNNLTSLPISRWTNLRNLKIVDCRHNMLSEVEESAIMPIQSLLELKMDGNAIPDKQVCAVHLILKPRVTASAASKSSPSVNSAELNTESHIDLTGDDVSVMEVDGEETDNGGVQGNQNIFELASNLGIGKDSDGDGAGVRIRTPVEPNELASGQVREQRAAQSVSALPNPPPIPAATALDKLLGFMTTNGLTNRADVRAANPSLWAEFAIANVYIHTTLGPCVLCGTPNSSGQHQRLNAVTMCLDCIDDVTARVRMDRRS